jgi:hypothetical protein
LFNSLRANPLAASALVVALMGASIAVVGLPDNSIGTKQIKKGAVHKSDLAKHSVTKAKLSPGAMPPRGATGPVGPTQGFIDSNAKAVPAPTRGAQMFTVDITMKTAGRIMGFGRGTFSVTCNVPGTAITAGLYLDGTPLVGSGTPLPSNGSPAQINLFGVTASSYPAGVHTLELGASCASGGFSQTDNDNADVALSALVIGS